MTLLRPPRLDDRSWDDLRRELIEAIPSHTPEWTDRHPSDPGVALIEAFAWLGQTLLQRMNLVPEVSNRHFLELLHVEPRSASPAVAFVQLSLPKGELHPLEVPERPSAPTVRVAAGGLEYQALGKIDVLPVEGRVWLKAALEAPNGAVFEGENELKAFLASRGLNGSATLLLHEASEVPPPAGVLPPPIPLDTAVDHAIWIGVFAPEGYITDKDNAARIAEKLEELRQAIAGHVISIGIRTDDELEQGAIHESSAPGTATRGYPVRWQITQGGPVTADQVLAWRAFQPLTVESDGTLGLLQSGVVRLRLPAADIFGCPQVAEADLEGIGDLPPRLEDADLLRRLVTWIRVFRPREPHPAIRWVGVNAVLVEQAVTQEREILGTGNGRPAQQVRLAHGDVLDGTLLLGTVRNGAEIRWLERKDFASSGPIDPHFILDRASGVVSFGDGIRGRMPEPGEIIRAERYRYGGGVAGRVPAGAIKKVLHPAGKLKAENPMPAEGGRDTEALAEARARIPQVLRHNDRAVSAEDFRDLAMATPSTHVGRVIVLPRHKPDGHHDDVPGVVTLVILPAYDPIHPEEPVPDAEMLRRVCAHLEPRRLVTTELYLVAPEYVPLCASVAIETERGYSQSTVARWVDLAIRQYLAPLPPYGPTGEGWPSGQSVRQADLMAAILRVEGVRLAHEVVLWSFTTPGSFTEITKVSKLDLERWQLPYLRKIQVVEGEEAEQISPVIDDVRPPIGSASGTDGADGIVVSVPVEKECC